MKARSKDVDDAGAATLAVKAKGNAKEKLADRGKVKVKLEVTFTPTGGDPNTETKKGKLKLGLSSRPGAATQPGPRKLPSSCLPSGVSTDSGWNWTPTAGSSRWRTPITTSSKAAVRSSSAGSCGVGDQRVVAAAAQRVRQAVEDAVAVVADLGFLAVDRRAADRPPAERLDQRLVAEADAEGRDAGLGEGARGLDRDPGFGRRARSR